MKVYTLHLAYPYEGGYFFGVFSTREKAEERMVEESWRNGKLILDEVEIDDMEVYTEI